MNEKLMKIKELLSSLLPEQEVIEMEAVTSDKAVLYVESIEVGKEVMVADENGENRTPAEDGEYLLEDGRTLVVADGKISEIKEKEEGPEVEPEETKEPETEEKLEDENPEPEVEPETEPEEDKEPERDLAKELDELKELVAELQKKLEKVETDEPKTPEEEFEAMKEIDKNTPKAVRYLQALRK